AGSHAALTRGAQGVKRGGRRNDVPHRHAHQGGPGEIQGPESDRADRQRLRHRRHQGCR
uniref:Uncharacterized protein n=1 Tax=Moschus moschiferus TaxID=68415 RepID=A0A8C6DEB5_MOSMO